MFKRPHHQKIATILDVMNADFLRETKCYFGGGTAISLMLDEYRESVDIDFLCADQDGYRKLREAVFSHGFDDIFRAKVKTLRDIRSDRDGIRAILVADETPVKFEIVRESRIPLAGIDVPGIPVPCLCKEDMFAEKLLANTDRFGDKAAMSRDVIDLLAMEQCWGPIPQAALDKAFAAYGNSVYAALQKAKDQLRNDPGYLRECLDRMGVDNRMASSLKSALGIKRNQTHGLGL